MSTAAGIDWAIMYWLFFGIGESDEEGVVIVPVILFVVAVVNEKVLLLPGIPVAVGVELFLKPQPVPAVASNVSINLAIECSEFRLEILLPLDPLGRTRLFAAEFKPPLLIALVMFSFLCASSI